MTKTNHLCEVWNGADWSRVKVEDALLQPETLKRCVSCKGPVRLKKAGRGIKSHSEHLEAFSGCVNSLKFDGNQRDHPLKIDANPEFATEFDAEAFADMRLIQEGRLARVNSARRQRSKRLLEEAKEYFRALEADGRLRCETCQWVPTVATEGEIVQIHHLRPLRSYRKSGERLSLRQALARLIPLCPNCHRMIESKPGGGSYTPDELKNLLL